MKLKLMFALLLPGAFLLAQNNGDMSGDPGKGSKGQITVQGCVGRSGGDYVLMKQNPAMTYELQGTHNVKLSHYLGQRVEVTGNESPSLSTSSDAMNKTGSAAATTISVSSIRTLDKVCPVR
jgi:hypothetical protein